MIATDLVGRYRHFLVDLWGVVWDSHRTFPGTLAFLRQVVEKGGRVYFLSNSAEFRVEELVERAREAGVEDVTEDWFLTSGQAMGLWFRQHGLVGKPVYAFAGEAVRENIRRAGATPLSLPDDPFVVTNGREADTLVLGGIHEFSWRRLQDVLSAVRLGGLRVMLPNPDKIVIQQTGAVTLPPGMIATVIEEALPEVSVERLGKPFPFIYEFAFDRMGREATRENTLMIGDSLDTDIRGATAAGIDSLLVGQGVHQGQSLERILELAARRSEVSDLGSRISNSGSRTDARPTYYVATLEPEAELREI